MVAFPSLRSPARGIQDSNRQSGWRHGRLAAILGAACSLFVWGCTQAQRDFYQAPPPEPAQVRVVTIKAQNPVAEMVTALGREGFDFEVSVRCPSVILGDILHEGDTAGRLLVVEHSTDSANQAAVEVRFGRFGNPREEARLAEIVAGSLSQSIEEPGLRSANSASAVRWTTTRLSGRWVDLEGAVAQAATTKGGVGYSVLGVDRWRFAIFFDLRSLADAEGRLIIIGDRESASGLVSAAVRIGRFGDPVAEAALLRRLRAALADLERLPRLPGAR